MKKSISLLLALLLTVSLAACGTTPAPSSTPASGSTSTSTSASDSTATPAPGAYDQKEAPMLAEQVTAGKLPTMDKRMPIAADVMVEPDVKELGKYGGAITITTNDGGRWNWGPWAEQSMFRFKQDGSGEVEANVCKSFEANADATVWTIKLRDGMRWSDGEPFTADDVLFYYDHMSVPALNADRTAVAPDAEGYYNNFTSKVYQCYQVTKDGKKYWAEFKKVGDYEFTVNFAAPKPSFAVDVAVDNKWMFLPKHFYKNYVARKDGVTDDATFPLIDEATALANANKDFGKAWEKYAAMSKDIGYYHWDYSIVPQVRSFIAVKDNWNAVGETYKLVRNPYFWKTDSEGRQLPYLDELDVLIINEQDQVTLKAMEGSLDIYQPPDVNYATIATALKDTHTITPWSTPAWDTIESIELNQTVKDLDKRALFQDKRFREALSICVDRNLLNETLMNGMSEPWQSSVGTGLPGHDDEWSKKWTEFDVAKANKLMDEMTEPWDGKAGTYRKMKGTTKDMEIILTIKDASVHGDFCALLATAYQTIGVKLSTKVDADARITMLSNDLEALIEATTVSTPALRPDSIVPIRNVAAWHSAYGKWYEDGKSEASGGIAPTGDMLALITAYDTMKAASGPDRDKVVAEQVQKIYDLHKENIWLIGYLKPLPARKIVNNHVKNFPEGLMSVDEFRAEGLARPEQLWRDDVK